MNEPTRSLKIKNSAEFILRIVVEPWAVEFDLPGGSIGEVISIGGHRPPDIEIEFLNERKVMAIVDGSLCEYWQDGKKLF